MTIGKTVTISEATKSTTAIRFGLSNDPPPDVLERMQVTASRIIDPVRHRFPRCIVSSFYRSPALNRKIGGSKTSQHVTGEAVDLDSPENVDNLAIFNFIKDELTFDQCILEMPDANGVPSWVHASIREKDNRGQVLVKLKDKYVPWGEYQTGMI